MVLWLFGEVEDTAQLELASDWDHVVSVVRPGWSKQREAKLKGQNRTRTKPRPATSTYGAWVPFWKGKLILNLFHVEESQLLTEVWMETSVLPALFKTSILMVWMLG